jgi:hypothetical protein
MAAVLALLCAAGAGAWNPVPGNLTTRWTRDVTPDNVLPEYPRPQMTRPEWRNLNGLWQFQPAIENEAAPVGKTLSGEILVPFPVESSLSGVGQHHARMWYRRTFTVPETWAGKRVLLHFGAVDWQTIVMVNGKHIGSHRGGYDPFSFDITDALTPGGPQELIVNVFDPTDDGEQPLGKQTLNPNDIWFSAVSGIWQTVWLEPAPETRIASFRATPDIDAGVLRVVVNGVNAKPGDVVRVVASRDGSTVGEASGAPGAEIVVPVPNASLWTPDTPTLYDLKLTLKRGDAALDEVGSYFGMRKTSVGKDEKGITRLLLNNKFVFQRGPLDQGYWPDGLYTAPTDAALRYDIEATKRLGFNMTRKHIKVEPARWYYWCDKLGLLVWQDMPNGENASQEARIQHEREMVAMINTLYNHPCIVMWVIFNEGWGQFDTERMTQRARDLDPSRVLNNASGWVDKGVGDINDTHEYPGPNCKDPEPTRATVCGEFGGPWCYVPDHSWKRAGHTYRVTVAPEEQLPYFESQIRKAWALRDTKGMSAYVYTEITDVEVEVAGLLMYDREFKFDPDRVATANRGETYTPKTVAMIAPTSKTATTTWKYTTTQPADTWMNPDFDASSWQTGNGGFGQTVPQPTGTPWTTGDIWLRREFTVTSLLDVWPVIRMFHDEDVEVYLNGVLAVKTSGFNTVYCDNEVLPEARTALKVGTNVLAIHCRQTGGGQYIDAGVGVRAAG